VINSVSIHIAETPVQRATEVNVEMGLPLVLIMPELLGCGINWSAPERRFIMGHQTQVKQLLTKDDDKWKCHACGKYDWTMIDFLGWGNLCYQCWMNIQEVMKEGESK